MQSVSFIICSLKVKCFHETGLKKSEKFYSDLVLLGKKVKSLFWKARKTFWKMSSTLLHNQNNRSFKIFMYIYAILSSAALHSLCDFSFQCLFVSCFINFLLLQKPHLFSFQLYFLWNYAKLERMQFCSHVHDAISFCKHSW